MDDKCFCCGKELFFFGSNDHVFKSYNGNVFCDCCLNELKNNEPRYKITIDIFDGSSIIINVSPKTATFKSCFTQVAKRFQQERITVDTHSLMLHGRNMTYAAGSRENNVFVSGLRNHDKLDLIRNDPVRLKITKLNGEVLEISELIGNSVCSVRFAIEKKYKIPESLQILCMGNEQLQIDKTLYHYDISNASNNVLSLVVKEDNTFTLEYLMLMKECCSEYHKTHTILNIGEFQNFVLQRAIEQGIQVLKHNYNKPTSQNE